MCVKGLGTQKLTPSQALRGCTASEEIRLCVSRTNVGGLSARKKNGFGRQLAISPDTMKGWMPCLGQLWWDRQQTFSSTGALANNQLPAGPGGRKVSSRMRPSVGFFGLASCSGLLTCSLLQSLLWLQDLALSPGLCPTQPPLCWLLFRPPPTQLGVIPSHPLLAQAWLILLLHPWLSPPCKSSASVCRSPLGYLVIPLKQQGRLDFILRHPHSKPLPLPSFPTSCKSYYRIKASSS